MTVNKLSKASFQCEYCENWYNLDDEMIPVNCPNMEDQHEICVYCAKQFCSGYYKKHISEYGGANAIRSGKDINWSLVDRDTRNNGMGG